jgi:hypothetical protein
MGPIAADEALAYLYRETFAEPHTHVPIENDGTFLAADVLGRGFSPLSWLKFLYVKWDLETDVHMESDSVSLKPLTKLAALAPVFMDFEFGDHDSWWNRHWMNDRRVSIQLDKFRSTYETLMEQGRIVTIRDHNSQVNLVGFYAMPREEWPAKMRSVFRTFFIHIDSDDEI